MSTIQNGKRFSLKSSRMFLWLPLLSKVPFNVFKTGGYFHLSVIYRMRLNLRRRMNKWPGEEHRRRLWRSSYWAWIFEWIKRLGMPPWMPHYFRRGWRVEVKLFSMSCKTIMKSDPFWDENQVGFVGLGVNVAGRVYYYCVLSALNGLLFG